MTRNETADALRDVLISPNVADSNGECANVVDGLSLLADAVTRVARAITPLSAAPGHDSHGGHIESLTEAMMGVGRSLADIASAAGEIAEAIVTLASVLAAR
jgi:hypothetical protein